MPKLLGAATRDVARGPSVGGGIRGSCKRVDVFLIRECLGLGEEDQMPRGLCILVRGVRGWLRGLMTPAYRDRRCCDEESCLGDGIAQ